MAESTAAAMAEEPFATAPGSALQARRALVLAVVAVVAFSRLAEGPPVWLAAGLVTLAVLLGALQALAAGDPESRVVGVPIESLFLPAVAGFAAVGLVRLVPVGPLLIVALTAVAVVLDRVLGLEARLVAQARGPGDVDRTRVLVAAMILAFLAFTGTAALVPGGLPEPGAAAGAAPIGEPELMLLAGVDALAGGLLGYRIAALGTTTLVSALLSALTYAGVIAIGAATLRVTDMPRLVGPALLTLVFFLWDAFHAAPTGRRRDPRWYGQVVLLLGLGGVVILWNLALR